MFTYLYLIVYFSDSYDMTLRYIFPTYKNWRNLFKSIIVTNGLELFRLQKLKTSNFYQVLTLQLGCEFYNNKKLLIWKMYLILYHIKHTDVRIFQLGSEFYNNNKLFIWKMYSILYHKHTDARIIRLIFK